MPQNRLDKDQRLLVEHTVLLNKRDVRMLFDTLFIDKWGHFIDGPMSVIIHSFADWIAYPKGNHILGTHENSVNGLVFSDDGYHLFTASADRNIIQWDMCNHLKISKWKAHDLGIWSLAYSSELLASGSCTGSLKIWDVSTSDIECIHDLKQHNDGILSLQFNGDDQLISAGCDRTLRLWRVKTGECLRIFHGHCDTITTAMFINDGTNMIITGSFDKTLRIWDTKAATKTSSTKECSRVISKVITDSVNGICINSDCSLIACLTNNGVMILEWPITKDEKETLVPLFKLEISSLFGKFHPSDPNILAISDSSGDHSIRFYHVRNGSLIATRSSQTRFWKTHQICFSPDGSVLANVSNYSTIELWDLSETLVY